MRDPIFISAEPMIRDVKAYVIAWAGADALLPRSHTLDETTADACELLAEISHRTVYSDDPVLVRDALMCFNVDVTIDDANRLLVETLTAHDSNSLWGPRYIELVANVRLTLAHRALGRGFGPANRVATYSRAYAHATAYFYPVFEELGEIDRLAFEDWLAGQTCPINPNGRLGFYPHDYLRWLEGSSLS